MWVWIALGACATLPASGQDVLGRPIDPPGRQDVADAGGPNAVICPGVPSYLWWYGCGPTAAGMIVGYWDAHGFGNLIPGSNDWDANRQAILDTIASPGHVRDYVPTPDRHATAEDPHHDDDCLADLAFCSRSPDEYGWSYFTYQDNALAGFAAARGYAGSAAHNVVFPALWDAFTDSIDQGRPVEFLVDTDGSGGTDHFVAAIGYDDTPGARRYACYDTWSHEIRWCDYRPIGSDWGVYGGTFFQPVPAPAALAWLAAGGLPLLRRRRARAA